MYIHLDNKKLACSWCCGVHPFGIIGVVVPSSFDNIGGVSVGIGAILDDGVGAVLEDALCDDICDDAFDG